MGVCKCKQRNVTNQFCYVCRMNVCESCMVKDHQRVRKDKEKSHTFCPIYLLNKMYLMQQARKLDKINIK